MDLFTIETRNINKLIYSCCDAWSLFRMRRCCVYLRDSIKECCYRIDDSQLYVNGKKVGWNKNKTDYYTDEYVEKFYHSDVASKIFFDEEYIFSTLDGDLILSTTVESKGKITYFFENHIFKDRRKVRSLTEYKNSYIPYSDYYILYEDRYFVISFVGNTVIGTNVNVYSVKSGIILEIKNCETECKVINHVNDDIYTIGTHIFPPLQETFTSVSIIGNIIRENFKEYL